MEAATIRRSRRRPRRRSHAAALLAVIAYAAFAAAAYVLVDRALDGRSEARPEAPAGPTETLAPAPDRLALEAVGARAQRSTVGVGAGTGFVAWQSTGLTLVLTARPAGGWQTGASRSVEVAYEARRFDGTLVRSDPRTGLGLVRIASADVAAPLWQVRRPARVRAGDLVALVGRTDASTATVGRVGARRIFLRGEGYGVLAGAPVLNASGRLVGVVDAGGGVVPIDRACGVIRRC